MNTQATALITGFQLAVFSASGFGLRYRDLCSIIVSTMPENILRKVHLYCSTHPTITTTTTLPITITITMNITITITKILISDAPAYPASTLVRGRQPAALRS